MKRRIAALMTTGLLMITLTACASRRVAKSDPARGYFSNLNFPDCLYNVNEAIVDCRCSKFLISVNAKTGKSQARCPGVIDDSR